MTHHTERPTVRPAFTRGFRLQLEGGRHLDGAEFPSGRVLVDDPEAGLATAAVSLDELLKVYPGARVEWPGDELVPTWALDELLRIVGYVTRGLDGVSLTEPYPAAAARRVLARLTDYLGAERVARTGQPADAGSNVYDSDSAVELLIRSLPPEIQRTIRAALGTEHNSSKEQS
ncbi:hypothetical protein ACIQRE_01870 [Streptomyces griseoluteus]|uniref:hypothetical protein n=1 Tax=Streptomyces griseoluteus TaxID=29306 RepID=UPI00381D1B07